MEMKSEILIHSDRVGDSAERGQHKRYYNCQGKFLGLKNYEVNIDEQNITVYFPNFKTECE